MAGRTQDLPASFAEPYPKRHELHERIVEVTKGEPGRVATPYGNVLYRGRDIIVHATENQAYEWAHRSGAAWPCSTLVRITRNREWGVKVWLTTGDVVDVDPADRDLDGTELDAWLDDVLDAVLAELDSPSHV